MLLGWITTKLLKLPSWVTPAISFNNTTALPLLLIESLASTGILDTLLNSDTDNVSSALMRAKSYFLVNAMIGDALTFALGPKLLDGEEAPTESKDDLHKTNGGLPNAPLFPQQPLTDSDAEQGNGHAESENNQDHEEEATDERTSLLPDAVVRRRLAVERYGYDQGRKHWAKLPHWLASFLSFSYAFLHAPLIGAAIGAVIGLTPPLHKAFFGDPQDGGIFRAWLTDSVKQIGGLFAALQVVVVGVKLSSSMRKMKRGEDSGTVPWIPLIFVTIMRFVIWPVISIAVIYGLASRTGVLDADPILWFVMMLMPTGPPAMKLTALADVSGSNESEKMSIAKFLCVSSPFTKPLLDTKIALWLTKNLRQIMYTISPLICFTVVGALKACKAAMAAT